MARVEHERAEKKDIQERVRGFEPLTFNLGS